MVSSMHAYGFYLMLKSDRVKGWTLPQAITGL